MALALSQEGRVLTETKRFGFESGESLRHPAFIGAGYTEISFFWGFQPLWYGTQKFVDDDRGSLLITRDRVCTLNITSWKIARTPLSFGYL